MKFHKRLIAFLLVVCLGAGVTLGAVTSNPEIAQGKSWWESITEFVNNIKNKIEQKSVKDWRDSLKNENGEYKHGIEVRPDFASNQSKYNEEVEKDHNVKGGMIRYKTFTIKNDVHLSNLFIGTYLISMKALTDEYYKLARQTQTRDNQNIDLYKSEQAKEESKLWADITEASSIKYITETQTGTFHSEEEVGEYWISVVIGEDGIPRDPATGEPIDAYGNPNIYDYLNLPELAPLKKLYDEIQAKSNPTAAETQHAFLTEAALVEAKGKHKNVTNGRNELTDRCDKVLNMLQFGLYMDYRNEKKEEEAKVISSLLEKTDATRRAEIYRFLGRGNSETLSRLAELAEWIKNGDEFEGDPNQFQPRQDYLDAIALSATNCQTSQAKYDALALHTGISIMAQEMYERQFLIQDQAITDNIRELEDMLVTGIIDLKNIDGGTVVEKDRERYETEVCLLPQANDVAGKQVLKRLGKDFWAARDDGKDEDTLTNMMDADIETLKNAVIELQEFIVAKKDRVDLEEALAYVHDVQLKWAVLYRSILLQNEDEDGDYSEDELQKIRDYRAKKQVVWDAHIRWLQNLIDELANLLNGKDGNSELIEEYEKKIKDAEEDDDPNTAKKYNYLLNREKGNSGSIGGTETDISKYTNDVNNMSGKDAKDGLKEAVKGNPSDKKAIAGAFAAAGDQNGLEDVLNSGGDGGDGGLSDQDKNDLRNEAANNNDGDGDGDGDQGDGSDVPLTGGSGDGSGQEIDADAMLQALLDFLGANDFASLGADVKGAMVVALNQFGRENNNETALELARKLLNEIMEEKNPLVYHKYTSDSYNEYVSFGGIDRAIQFTKYRYVFKNGKETMTQVPGSGSYMFEPLGTEGVRSDEKKVELQMALVSLTDSYIDSSQSYSYPYIDEIDGKLYLGVRAEYIIDTEWAVIVTEPMEKQVAEFVEILRSLFA